ncbi:hypothetical protein [uncultured Phenylobacterium sp.]|nr:hypothetical protein [uncultured Phenylobacterium sp.]
MRAIIEPPPEPGAALRPLWQRLAWFVGLAVMGAGATAGVSYAMRLLLR